jgi:hypothetical protein
VLTLVVGLSGISEAKDGDTYYGTVPGTDYVIGIEVLGNNHGHWAGAFLCNAERLEPFSGRQIKTNRLNLTSAEGSGVRIKAVVSKQQIRGTLRLAENVSVRFTAARTDVFTPPFLRCPTLGGPG